MTRTFSRRVAAVGLLIVIAFVLIRTIMLDADPPRSLPNGQRDSWELVVEGPAKAHEARKRALYGTWSTNDRDEYQFWRAQSPAWVIPVSWVFRAFGVGWTQLRWTSIAVSAFGFAGLLLLAWRRYMIVGVATVAVFFGLDSYLFHYERAGLLEPAVNAWLVLTVLALLRAFDRVWWLLPATFAFVGALMSKQTAAFFAPVFVCVWLVAMRRSFARGTAERSARRAIVASGAIILATAAWWVSREEYLRTIVWNFRHVVLAGSELEEIVPWRVLLVEPLVRFVEPERLRQQLILLVPVMLPLAFLQLGVLVHAAVRRLRVDAFELTVAGWALCAFAALQATPHVRVRFSLILFPPMVLLAAGGMRWLSDRFGSALRRRSAVVVTLLLVSLAVHARWFVIWAERRPYELRECNRRAAALLSRGDVVIGSASAALAFDSEADHFYVKPPFNGSTPVLRALGVTHVLDQDGGRDIRRMRSADVRWRAQADVVSHFDYKGTRYSLWMVR